MFFSGVKGKCAMKIGKLTKTLTVTMLGAGLAGCSFSEIAGLPPDPQINSAYTALCSVTSYLTPPDCEEETEFCFEGRVKRLGTGFWEMEITSPETLAGMKICASGDTVDSSLGELSFSLPAENVPVSSPFMELFSALDSAALSQQSLSSGENGGWVMELNGCTILFDGSGVPVSMSASYPKITAEFTEFKVITLGESTA